eukprot:4490026-Amphidinium_carterae.1
MVMLRPQSTVDEACAQQMWKCIFMIALAHVKAFSALKHEDLLRGDFVRAELLGDGGNVQVSHDSCASVMNRTNAVNRADRGT